MEPLEELLFTLGTSERSVDSQCIQTAETYIHPGVRNKEEKLKSKYPIIEKVHCQ